MCRIPGMIAAMDKINTSARGVHGLLLRTCSWPAAKQNLAAVGLKSKFLFPEDFVPDRWLVVTSSLTGIAIIIAKAITYTPPLEPLAFLIFHLVLIAVNRIGGRK